jgi:hypothetical protein
MLDILNNSTTRLAPSKIRTDGGTQPRVGITSQIIIEYAEAIGGINDWPFPPIIVYFDGSDYWLADGFHRLAAANLFAERNKIAYTVVADVRQGTQRDAILHSVGANADHGLRRTSEDKRRAVLRLLEDNEWTQWSNREIARRCRVDEKTVRTLRDKLTAENPQLERTYTTKHGTTATMNTANIGASTQQPPLRSAAPTGRDGEGLSDGIQTTQHGGGFVAYNDKLQLATEPWNTPQAALAAFASTAQQKHYRSLYAQHNTPRPATIPDIITMINYVNETADVLTVDLEWLVDYLQSMGQRKGLTTKPGDLHAIIKQWRRDTLDKQEEEIRQRRLQSAQPAPDPQPEPAAQPEPTAPSPSTGRDGEGYTTIAQALADARHSTKWAQDHMPEEQTTSNGALHMALRKIIADIDVANHLTNRLIKKSE